MINACEIANLFSLLTWEGRYRPRRIDVPEISRRYLLTRIIGLGASSTIYQARCIPLTDDGQPARSTYPPASPLQGKQKPEGDVCAVGMLALHDVEEDGEASDDFSDDDISDSEWSPPQGLFGGDGHSSGRTHSSTRKKRPAVDTMHLRAETEATPVGKELPKVVLPFSTNVERTSEDACAKLVIKFSKDPSSLENELEMEEKLPEPFRVGWNLMGVYILKNASNRIPEYSLKGRSGSGMIIGRLHSPLIRTAFGPPPSKHLMTMRRGNYRELLENLKAIHRTGMVHRDIRLPNILWNAEQKRFILCDYGFSCQANINSGYSGSIETASNRILRLRAVGYKSVRYLPEDDLESLMKLFKTNIAGYSLPQKTSSTERWCRDLFVHWSYDADVREMIRRQGYEAKLEYLDSFCRCYSSYDECLDDLMEHGLND